MRILIIGDTHFHNWKYKQISEYQEKFLSNFLPSTVREHKPDIVVFLGDIFESRTVVDKKVIYNFVEGLYRLSYVPRIYIVIGNHDYYMSSDNSVLKFVERISNVEVVTSPKVERANGLLIGFLPWPYWKDYTPEINACDIIFSHIQVSGVSLNPRAYILPKEGFVFNFTKPVILFNGHYHYPMVKNYDNSILINVGSIQQNDVSEVGQEKRLYLFDSLGPKIEEIKLPHPKFVLFDSLQEYQESMRYYDPQVIPYYNVSKVKVSSRIPSAIKGESPSESQMSLLEITLKVAEEMYSLLDERTKGLISSDEIKRLIKNYFSSPAYSILK